MVNKNRSGQIAPLLRSACLACLLVIGATVSGRADGAIVTTCVGGWWGGATTCARIYRKGVTDPHVRRVPQPTAESDIAEANERDRQWLARCRPTAHYDVYGVRRYEYAATGCEHGRTE